MEVLEIGLENVSKIQIVVSMNAFVALSNVFASFGWNVSHSMDLIGALEMLQDTVWIHCNKSVLKQRLIMYKSSIFITLALISFVSSLEQQGVPTSSS